MFIDDKGRIFGKVSIVDIVVVLLILAAVSGTYYKFFLVRKGRSVAQFDTIQYQVQVKDVRKASVDAIEEGAAIFDDETGNSMGKIISKEIQPAKDYIVKTDGTYVEAEKPDRYTVIVTIETPGVENDYGYFANGTREIKRGSDLKLKTRLIAVETRVMDVKKIGGQ
ncbi:MAG: hypothetical protein PWR27_485 [Petroclostridium sp.]|uniref:DUF4330 domain-containing protein n=1 Tax=Petroclostridium xylanilyticum TaxID=1792311 RepID=UPI0012FFBD88|nr:DUF4330 domain-containing protein [Petroclostridium xylanilyticum]MBZ4645598.1 hypothetical protein [Clostridia bacterium]MDK2809776.1 hypothetical protein [Petroclostridium sp.]